MFVEISASAHVQIPCHSFTDRCHRRDASDDDEERVPQIGNLVDEVMNHLLIEYSNKIIPPHHGLCITVSAIDKIGDARIFPEDGSTYLNVDFRLILFRPYHNEVIEGEIATADASGIRISLGFFEQVFVPHRNLPKPSTFNEETECWEYRPTAETVLQFEREDIVHLKVVDTVFKPSEELHKIAMKSNRKYNATKSVVDKEEKEKEKEDVEGDEEGNDQKLFLREKLPKEPMVVYGTLDGQGLGPSSWWTD